MTHKIVFTIIGMIIFWLVTTGIFTLLSKHKPLLLDIIDDIFWIVVELTGVVTISFLIGRLL